MLYRVRHVSTYDYGHPVDLGAHMLHLTPRALPWQKIISASVSATPTPSRCETGRDCFGNDVTWLFLDQPHPRFEATLEALVDVAAPAPPPASETPSWSGVASAAKAGGRDGFEAAEFIFDSPLAPAGRDVRDYAAQSFPGRRPILEALLDLNTRIKREFSFKPGATTVGTPVREVLAQKAGVCQDFSHLMIAGLRALGLPARYVSGYIRTHPKPGEKRRPGSDVSHAWVGCWMGPRHGWIDLDPTNGLVIADEHVVLGWGRDFNDVSPLRGIILGGGEHDVEVSVDLTPV
jgi:transglutaminase-like putative cysteine protease